MRIGIRVPGRPARTARALAAVGAAAAVALAVAACSSSGTSTAKSGTSTNNTSDYLKWAPCCSWGTTWSLNQYSPISLGIGQGLIQLPLAVENDPSLTSFTPQLATSWTVSGDTLTINLRPGVNWQNGKPVTSTDVLDTLVLNGTNGSSGWNFISSVSAPSSSQVVVTARAGTNMTLLEDDLLPTIVLPASQYGKFVTPTLMQDDSAYYAELAKNPNAANKMAQYTAMEADFKKLAAANIPTFLGDGPYELKAINTSEALLTKWSGFYDAASIHVPGIDYIDQQNQGIYPLLLSGQADFSNVYMSPSILNEWAGTSGSNTAIPEGFTFSMMFNDSRYPLNITAVRQALAYVIPRSNMVSSAYGGASVKDRGGELNSVLDGLPAYEDSLYLTPSQIASLNPYPVNDAKAASLLESVGFKKSGGSWIEPNGKPFTLTFMVDSATSDIVSSFDVAASALTAFGIKSTEDATQGTIQGEDLDNGNFQINMNFVGGPDPLANYDQFLGSGINFEKVGNYAGDKGVGFGPTEDVPGLGTVNVPTTLDEEAESVGPGAQMNALTYDWAKLVNEDVPFITYATKVYQFPFSSANFTDWPPMNSAGTSPLWNILGQGNMTEGLTIMLEDGYIRPKS